MLQTRFVKNGTIFAKEIKAKDLGTLSERKRYRKETKIYEFKRTKLAERPAMTCPVYRT